jgi:putative ABC transport system substrate-binding protein
MQSAQLGRREFITLVCGTAAWPIAALAQRPPVVGFLNGVSFDGPFAARQAVDIRQGLRAAGYVEGQNLTIEYRSAEGRYDRLPALAADLVSSQVALIIAVGSTNAPQAARAATSTIPIVFAVGSDPVATGLVTNLTHPEANVTGVTFNSTTLAPKRLEIVRELLSDKASSSIGYLKNPRNPFDVDLAGLMAAGRALGLQISIFEASTDREFLAAFQSMAQQHLAALIVSNDALFVARRDLIVALAAHHAIPTIYNARENILAGGLISYGPEVNSLHRQAGLYAGRILKGEKPADLPSTESTLTDAEAAARTMGLQIQVRNASTNLEIDAVFAGFRRERPDALFVGGDPFFGSRRVQFATLTAHYSIPTAYTSREYAQAGGLMSYGASFTDSFRQAGTYVGRILKGAKPANLPVTQPTKFELVINAETARMLDLAVPPTLLSIADEVIG